MALSLSGLAPRESTISAAGKDRIPGTSLRSTWRPRLRDAARLQSTVVSGISGPLLLQRVCSETPPPGCNAFPGGGQGDYPGPLHAYGSSVPGELGNFRIVYDPDASAVISATGCRRRFSGHQGGYRNGPEHQGGQNEPTQRPSAPGGLAPISEATTGYFAPLLATGAPTVPPSHHVRNGTPTHND